MINNKQSEWKHISNSYSDNINNALQQQHQAAQFIALVGHHLIPQKPDDSNTNMEFDSQGKLLIGNSFANEIRIAFHLVKLKLLILDRELKTKKVISLDGKTKKKVFEELSQSLADLGVDISTFSPDLHYDIPPHNLDKDGVFVIDNEAFFIENTNYRNNAKIVLNEVSNLFEKKEDIRIWPHHFDTGAFYTIKTNEKGETKQTIGIGFAIPDTMVDDPYYYLSFWSDKPLEGIENINELEKGNWMMPNWSGAILKLSEIISADTAEEQHMMVKSFFTEGIEILSERFKNN